MGYREEDFLLLSGIQHFCFCRRQWALIHIEQQWKENLKTVEGNIVHENCHDEHFFEKRGDLLITRGIRIFSRIMGVTGQCDVVEFYKSEEGCLLHGYGGYWLPYPVEYKRGKSKSIDADRLQLCGQAMCLEEMLGSTINKGAIYYHESNRREEVQLTASLRKKVKDLLAEMHEYYSRGYTPVVKAKSGCASCSLKEICMPGICKKINVDSYYSKFLNEDMV